MKYFYASILILSVLMPVQAYVTHGGVNDWKSVTNKSAIEDIANDGDFLKVVIADSCAMQDRFIPGSGNPAVALEQMDMCT